MSSNSLCAMTNQDVPLYLYTALPQRYLHHSLLYLKLTNHRQNSTHIYTEHDVHVNVILQYTAAKNSRTVNSRSRDLPEVSVGVTLLASEASRAEHKNNEKNINITKDKLI